MMKRTDMKCPKCGDQLIAWVRTTGYRGRRPGKPYTEIEYFHERRGEQRRPPCVIVFPAFGVDPNTVEKIA